MEVNNDSTKINLETLQIAFRVSKLNVICIISVSACDPKRPKSIFKVSAFMKKISLSSGEALIFKLKTRKERKRKVDIPQHLNH